MKNERGLTLVELLGVLAITGILLALLTGILMNGLNASKRNTINQQLQQEVNYITEVVRKEYLKTSEQDTIELQVVGDTLKMDGKVISQGYGYSVPSQVRRNRSTAFFYITVEKNGLSFNTETTFSKLE